jgi:hypothetical protein
MWTVFRFHTGHGFPAGPGSAANERCFGRPPFGKGAGRAGFQAHYYPFSVHCCQCPQRGPETALITTASFLPKAKIERMPAGGRPFLAVPVFQPGPGLPLMNAVSGLLRAGLVGFLPYAGRTPSTGGCATGTAWCFRAACYCRRRLFRVALLPKVARRPPVPH